MTVGAGAGGGEVGVGGTAVEDGTAVEAVGVVAERLEVGTGSAGTAAAVETDHCTCAASLRRGWAVGVLGRVAAIRTANTCMPLLALTGHVTMGRL